MENNTPIELIEEKNFNGWEKCLINDYLMLRSRQRINLLI